MGVRRALDGHDGPVKRFGLALALLFATFAASRGLSAGDSSMHDRGLVEFARDFSGNNPALIEKVKRYIAKAPTRIEDIGFYGLEDDTPHRRQWLATVSALADDGHLTPSEDKYSNEFIHVLAQDQQLDLTGLPEKIRKFWIDIGDRETSSDPSFGKKAAAIYGEATMAVEALLASRGKALLSIDATDGDTMYFAVVDKTLADKWRGTGFGDSATHDGGVRDPMWDRYWSNLQYAVGERWIVDQDAYPPGTRLREAAGPLKPYASATR